MNHDISRSKSLERLRPVALSVLGHRYYYQLHPGYLPGGRYRGVLTVSVVAIYILVVACFGSLLQAQGNLGIALLATSPVDVLFQPLRTRLQQAVNHLLYGDRDESYRVISLLRSRLGATLATEAVLPSIVETVACRVPTTRPGVCIDCLRDRD